VGRCAGEATPFPHLFLADNFRQSSKIEIEIKKARPLGGLFHCSGADHVHRPPLRRNSATPLERLMEEQALAALTNANPVPCGNSQQQNRLQVAPMK